MRSRDWAPRGASWLVLCLMAAILAVCLTAAGAASAKLTPLTHDGKSYFERGGGFAPQGNLVAFFRKVTDTTRQLIVLDMGTRKETVISPAGYPFNAAWSRDGKLLGFLQANAGEADSQTVAMIWHAETGKLTRTAAEGRFSDFASYSYLIFSPDETRAAFEIPHDLGSVYVRLFIVPCDGSATIEVSPNNQNNSLSSDQDQLGAYPWSPEGRLVFIGGATDWGDGRVWTCDSQGQNLVALTPPYPCSECPLWSPDGQRIAFRTAQGRLPEEMGKFLTDLWVINPDGSDPHPLTHGSDPAVGHRKKWVPFLWMPDGKYLLSWMTQYDDNGLQKYRGLELVPAAGGEHIPVLIGEDRVSEALSIPWNEWALSPSGQYLTLSLSRYRVLGAKTANPIHQDERSVLAVFDLATHQSHDLLDLAVTSERRQLWSVPSWSNDGRQILVNLERIITLPTDTEAGKYEPDLYLVDLPPELQPPAPLVAAPVATTEALPTAPTPSEAATGSVPPIETPGVTGNEELTAAQGSAPSATVETAPATSAPEALAEQPSVVLVVPNRRRASEIAAVLPDSYRDLYKVDSGLNAFVVTNADPAQLARFQRDVTRLDQPLPQVMVDVLVTELSGDASKELGFDWEFTRGRWGALLPMVDSGAGQVIYSGVGKLDSQFYVTLSALQQQGTAKVRTNPRVVARCGEESTIGIRKTDNFFYQSGLDYNGHPSYTKSDISADIILKLTPQLLGSGEIALALDATIETFTFAVANDLPDTTRRQAVTDVVCRDGDSIILGGLTQDEETKTVTKTPLLGDLPLIGQLFRQTHRNSRETTLVIFVTPHVVSEQQQPGGNPF